MMKVDLDYTGMSSYSWSEAKLENKFADDFDISAYNLLSFDYYYPAAMSGSKIKIFLIPVSIRKQRLRRLRPWQMA